MVLEELASRLVASGQAALGIDLWLHVAPDEPDNLMVLTEYAGDEPEFIQENRLVDLEAPRVQLGVRGTAADEVRSRAEDAYQLLMDIRNESLQGTRYMWCRPIDTPALIGRDDSGRFLVTINFSVKKELTSA